MKAKKTSVVKKSKAKNGTPVNGTVKAVSAQDGTARSSSTKNIHARKKSVKKSAHQKTKKAESALQENEIPFYHYGGFGHWLEHAWIASSTSLSLPFCLTAMCILFSMSAHGQILGKTVTGCGAATLLQQDYIHRATLGQAVIGRLSTPSQDTHHVGFWYAAYSTIRRAGGAVVSLPVMEANLGETISVPLMVVSSANIANSKQNFIARIRYNNTLLMPLDASIPLAFEGNDAILTIVGKITEASGIVATLRFKVMMGNAPRTPLNIEAFSIGTKNNFTIVKKDGEVLVKDLCQAGDTTRLFNRGLAAALSSIRPNPVASTADIDFTLSETGFTSLSLMDLSGRKVATIWEAAASKGYYTKPFAVGTLSNGEYFLQLQTPNELFVMKLIIQR